MFKSVPLNIALALLLLSLVWPFFFVFDAKGIIFDDGDIHYYFNGTFSFKEDIILKGNTTLVIENATIEFVQSKDNQYGIKLLGSNNGGPYLKVKNATFTSSKGFNVSLSGLSKADVENLKFGGSGKSKCSVRVYGNSSFYIYNSNIPRLYGYGFAELRVIGVDSDYLETYDYSCAEVSTSKFRYVKLYGFSSVNMSLSSVYYGVVATDSSSFLAIRGSFIKDIKSQGNSTIVLKACDFYQAKVETGNYGSVILQNATSTPSKFPFEFKISGNSRVDLADSKLSDAFFKVYGNSTLSVAKSFVSSSIIYFYNFSRGEFLDSQTDWLVESFAGSNVNANNSKFNIFSLEDFSSAFLKGCDVGQLRCYESSRAVLSDSNVEGVKVELLSVDLTLNNFKNGYFDEQSFTTYGGLNITFVETSVDVGWSFSFLGDSNVLLNNSEVVNLFCADASKVYLQNTTYLNLNVVDSAEVKVFSYLTVQVRDYFGNPVKGAEITVANVTHELSKVTDEDGEAVFLLVERVVNGSGNFNLGAYRVNVTYNGNVYKYDLELAGSKTVVCVAASPWWYWYAIYGGGAAVVLAALGFSFWYFKRRKEVVIDRKNR